MALKKYKVVFVYSSPFMKKLTLGFMLLACHQVQAQENVVVSEAISAVVYEAPVIYQAPVVYNAPVIYNAPVYYVAPTVSSPFVANVDYVAPVETATSVEVIAPVYDVQPAYQQESPNVIIMGRGSFRTSWETTPNVIIMGRSASPSRPASFRRHR